MKIETYNDLKIFLSGLTDEQLTQKVYLSVVDSHYEKIAHAGVTKEDEYVNDDGVDPVSVFEPLHEGHTLSDHEIIPAGRVYLSNE